MRNTTVVAAFLVLPFASPARSQERGIELGAVLASTSRHELDTTDMGFGGRVGFQVTPLTRDRGEMRSYPSNVPSVFGKARAGFVRFAPAPEAIACILIYPPPLTCLLAEGRSVLDLDLGGGIELYPTDRSLVRVDVSNLLHRYPGPSSPLHFFGRDLLDAVPDQPPAPKGVPNAAGALALVGVAGHRSERRPHIGLKLGLGASRSNRLKHRPEP